MFLDIASLIHSLSQIAIYPKLTVEKKAGPLAHFYVFVELGIHNLQDILCKNQRAKPILIHTAELKRRFGALRVTHQHQIALKSLTLLVDGGMIQAETLPDAAGHNSCKSLPAHVDPALLEADAITQSAQHVNRAYRQPDNSSAAA